jgi:hypothetical protein
MSSVISISNLDSKKIIITKLKLNKATKKYSAAFLHVEGKQANVFAYETSYLSIDFPPNYYGEQNKDSIVPEEQRNYSIVLRPNGGSMEVPEQTESFMGFNEDLKNMAVDFAIENSQTILKKKFEKSQRDIMIETSFTYPIKQKQKPDGEFYPPNIAVKIPKKKDSNLPDFSLFIDNNGKIEQVELTSWEQLKDLAAKNIKCKAIIRVMLSFVNKSMNFTFRLVQLKLFTVDKLSIPRSYAFSDVPMVKSEAERDENASDAELDEGVKFGIETIIVESDEEIDVSNA